MVKCRRVISSISRIDCQILFDLFHGNENKDPQFVQKMDRGTFNHGFVLHFLVRNIMLVIHTVVGRFV